MAVHSVHCEAVPYGSGPAREILAAFLADLAQDLAAHGCTFIGHVKGMAVAPGEETLFFSLTRLEGLPEFKGGAWTSEHSWELAISAILAGMGEEEIEHTMSETLEIHFRMKTWEAKT